MDFLVNFFRTIQDAGAVVMLPIIITIFGMIFRLSFAKAFRSGLTVAIGFAGINLVINLLKGSLGSASQAMVKNWGIKLDILDVGWGSIAAVTWASPIIAILIFAILAVNILLLVLNRTDTLDVDIWNYHHMAIVGIMVYFVTHNIWLALLSTIVMAVITFKLSDWTAPLVEKFFGLPGVSLPTVSALSSVIIAAPLNAIIDRIPGLNKIDFSLKDAQKYLGIFGEPMMIGLFLGGIIGFLAKYPVADIMRIAVEMAAVLVLIPKMISLFAEGLMPISEAAQKFTQEKFKGKKLLIGLDAAVIVGNSSVITTSLVVIPLTIVLATLLPGNRVLPFADLAVVTFRIAMVVAIARGNLFRSILIGLVVMSAVLYGGTITSPVLTELAASVGLDVGGGGLITSFAATSLTVSFLVFEAFIHHPIIWVPVLLIVIGAVWFYIEKVKKFRNFEENKNIA
ncbi:PTS transporter subunit IIC [Caldifermentibacillus hisashii]|uniref:PTS galactitol transporter subunit IIC n=1 Tax=Bacillaceae TaxID=186817 RepID=UPI000BA4D3ED|nr:MULTISPECIES: PTS transporter subunit IIC [Bacillaceae]MCM3476190.1 PTS galactitol transporter subunit IIC [Caldibacillus thermoamylovorans]MED3644984.1 PTS transporter subunit IIC [Caldifermentibacillus hisashii]PAC35630.1 PTS galactitol transporter subunit IIC [Caldifermentibacillus hisashii]